MREAGRLAQEEQARRLSDFLLTEGIDNTVEALGDAWVLWVYQEDQLERAQAEVAAFQRDPTAKKYARRARRAESLRKGEAGEEKRAVKTIVEFRKEWKLSTQNWRPVTMLLIAACVVVAVATDLGAEAEPGSLLQGLSLAPYTPAGTWTGLSAVAGGQLWRLVTPILLHFHWAHLLFNLSVLHWLGNSVEARRGSLRFAVFVLVLAVASNLGQYLVSGPAFGGLSGVLYGLVAYTYLKGRYEPQLGLGIGLGTLIFMLGWLLLGFSDFFPFANGAHLVGLVTGGALGAAPVLWRILRR